MRDLRGFMASDDGDWYLAQNMNIDRQINMKGVNNMTYLNLYQPKSLFEEVFHNWPFDTQVPTSYGKRSALGSEIRESDTDFQIRLEVPGVAKDDIDVSYKDQILTVRAEKKDPYQKEEDDDRYGRFDYGVFERRYRVPDVDFKAATGEVKDGVLSIRLPRVKEKQLQTLSIS